MRESKILTREEMLNVVRDYDHKARGTDVETALKNLCDSVFDLVEHLASAPLTDLLGQQSCADRELLRTCVHHLFIGDSVLRHREWKSGQGVRDTTANKSAEGADLRREEIQADGLREHYTERNG